tara:strand:+ start:763 stop:2538 length:1776 start_codon:yes stop_codon:yes gene_type:complete
MLSHLNKTFLSTVMGIPSLFRTIASKYEETHYWKENLSCEVLYFDYNCLIHYCKSKISIHENSTTRDVEEDLIAEVIRYTIYIITKVIKPTRLVYISIDGSVPMAKVIKQRARRYKKIQDDSVLHKMQETNKIDKIFEFNGNKITPGTTFMAKLSQRIRHYISLGFFSSHNNASKYFKVFFSDANIPGEGEQKIMQFIRHNNNNPSTVIYGLDADLIILSMNMRKNIKLLREPQNSSVELAQHHSEFLYLDIELLSNSLLKEYGLQGFSQNRIIEDFLFFSFLGGNDFVEHLFSTQMREQGLDKLFIAYSKIKQLNHSDYLIDGTLINFSFLASMLGQLTNSEDHFAKKKRVRHFTSSVKTYENDYFKNKFLYEHSFYSEKMNPFHEFYNSTLQAINYKLEHNVWKYQYNEYFFHSNIEDACHDYIKSLIWTFRYYTIDEVPSWDYSYNYRAGPCVTDLHNYLIEQLSKSQSDLNETTFVPGSPMLPIEQLAIVIPPQHAHLLPFSYYSLLRENSPIEHLCPRNFKLDVLKGLKNIYSDPILPNVYDLQHAIKIIMLNVEVSDPEVARNIIREKPFYFCNTFINDIKNNRT